MNKGNHVMHFMQTTTGRLLGGLLVLACGLGAAPALRAQSIYSQPYTFTTLAGSPGYGSADGTGAAARFYYPYSVALDSAGNLYVADASNHAIRKVTPAGVVSTFAGRAGSPGMADGTGAAARFNCPHGVAVDRSDNLYVADYGNATIRKITPAGVVTTLAGRAGEWGSTDDTGSRARFYNPSSVAVDHDGNVYVADTSNCTIRKITPTGAVSTLAGLAGSWGCVDGTNATARFTSPRGVAVGDDGTVYVADTGNHVIRKITPTGVVSFLAGMAGNAGRTDGTGWRAQFNGPVGVAVDGTGMVYVADANNSTIRKITPAGVVTTLAGLAMTGDSTDGIGANARFNSPFGLAVDSAGTVVYVADSKNHTLRKVTSAGEVTTLAGSVGYGSADGTGANARFNKPYGVAVDSRGNVYVTDHWNHTLRKVTPRGVVTTLAGLAKTPGSADGTGTAARFYYPYGVAVDSADNLYVADSCNYTLRKITPAGVVTTLAGSAGASGSVDGTGRNARFKLPQGVAVDRADNLYVADVGNNIRKVTPAGEVSTLSGLGSGDVAVDGAGNIFAPDTFNNTIRKLTPAGEVSIVAGMSGELYWGYADGTGSDARFHRPRGLAVDGGGNIFVADTDSYTLRKISGRGMVSTLAGLVEVAGSTDGTGAAVRFWNPYAVAVDRAGTVYVADTDNFTIRVGRPPAAPLLSVSAAGGQLVLSWPLEASDYLVEASSSRSPEAAWSPLTNAVAVEGNRCVVTNRLDSGMRFFRLCLP